MQDTNRADPNRNRELLEVVLQTKEDQRLSSGVEDKTLQRLGKSLHVNDGSRHSSFMSKRSTNLSQSEERLDKDQHQEKQPCKHSQHPVHTTLLGLGLLCLLSVIECAVTLQLVSNVASQNGQLRNGTLLSTSRNYSDVIEVFTALTSFVIVLCISCLLVCSMQCFFISRLQFIAEGEQRCLKFLAECSSSRTIAVFGYFISLPLFLISLLLYMVLTVDSTPAITAIIILLIGVLFGILSSMQIIYHWHHELSRAQEGLPVFDGNGSIGSKSVDQQKPRNELNTLV